MKEAPRPSGTAASVTINEFVVNPLLELGQNNSTEFEGREQKTLPPLKRVRDFPIQVVDRDAKGAVRYAKGALPIAYLGKNWEIQAKAYLEALGITSDDVHEWRIAATQEKGRQVHLKLQEYYHGYPVFDSGISLHGKNGLLSSMTGRYQIEDVPAAADALAARTLLLETAQSDLANTTEVLSAEEMENHYLDATPLVREPVFFRDAESGKLRLAYHISLQANLLERWEYFVDARTAAVIHRYVSSCSFLPTSVYFPEGVPRQCNHDHDHHAHHASTMMAPPPAPTAGTTAFATDLKGVTRQINVYEDTPTSYGMIDIDRSMFNASSVIPSNMQGVIFTLDAENRYPNNSNFDPVLVLSNNNTWNDPRSVSAHFHAAEAYTYFLEEHQRNSINGEGGNIIAIYNVSDEDGSGLDNAFWNGQAMFYGNGNQAFTAPLQKSLDVAGHEMSHGVIENSAGLVYQGQSGALNESFADVFGVLVDPGDFQLGEDVVNSNIFPSGALRDMGNPNQGGSGLGSPGWQPAHMNEYQDLPLTQQGDNGGVHVNSGIPNRAFFLFANAIGLESAGKVYYDVLTNYLNQNSDFIDMRNAVIAATEMEFGASSSQVNAAISAFQQVGLGTGSTGGSGGGSTEPGELMTNTGDDFLVVTDLTFSGLFTFDGTNVGNLTETNVKSRPSFTDNGREGLFVASDNTLRYLQYNESTGQYSESFLEANPQTIWRNVAISKDGNRLAALTTAQDNTIFVFDFQSGSGQTFTIQTTTSAQGVSTSSIRYADVIEWSYDGNFILFDAYNVLSSNIGISTDYWDIGEIRVWNTAQSGFGDGFVFRLFSGLPDNSSIGNPTYAKTAPHIIAFDFIGDAENFTDFSLLAVNTVTGDVGGILNNTILSYPHYSPNDEAMLLDGKNQAGEEDLYIINLNEDKITASGSASELLGGAQWGLWITLGERDLVDTKAPVLPAELGRLFPNPSGGEVFLELDWSQNETASLELWDQQGRAVMNGHLALSAGKQVYDLKLPELASGGYVLRLNTAQGVLVKQVIVE